MLKIAIILGMRPEILKMSPVIRACEGQNVDFFHPAHGAALSKVTRMMQSSFGKAFLQKKRFVIGSRFLDENHKNGIRKWRVVGMKVLDLSTKVAGKVNVTDSQSGYRAYGRRAIEAIKINNPDMGAGSEILIQVQEKQLKVAEIPINVRYDLENTSSKNPVKHGFGVLGSIVQAVAVKRPMRYIGIPGLALIMIGFYFGLTLLRQYNRIGYFSLPFTLLAGFFIIVGVLGVFISRVLNVISRLLQEREGRE